METYSPEIERQMQKYYQSLCKKNHRRYAAIEAVKLGYGGITYISKQIFFDDFLPKWNYTAKPQLEWELHFI